MQFNGTKYYALLLCCLSTTYSLSAKDAVLTDMQQSYAHNNLGFIQNVGQVTNQYHKTRTDVQFNLKRDGVSLFLSAGELHYQFNNLSTNGKKVTDKAYRMDVALLGANTHAKAVTADMQEYTEQYTIAGKMLTAKSFDKVTYVDVYPGIDWALYIKGDKVEYDFIVHPGADASQIQLKYGGATTMHLSENGGLVIKTQAGEVKENTPYTYALNTKENVASSFSLDRNVLSFNVATHEGTIVIDPQLQWSTYYGGTGLEELLSVATDASNNVYSCGYTTSTANIATTGAYQTVYNANTDAVLVKFTAAGAISWATYFGGSGTDQANAVTTDKTGNVYITGNTSSAANIAFNTTVQTSNGGGSSDAFLAKFNSAGAIQWSTYIGGTGADISYAVVCDKWRSVYIVGSTASTNGITAGTNVFSSTANALLEGFINRFDTSGNRIWGTYYGPNAFFTTSMSAASVDPAGYLYVVGQTNNTSNIATANAYQSAPAGTGFFPSVAFIVKFDSSDNQRWATYYGAGTTQASGVANDTLGNVYMSGYTSGTTNIASANAYQAAYAGGATDGYLTKFDTAGDFIWGTYYGGPGPVIQKGITIDNFGNPMITGYTTSATGIASTNNGVYQTALSGTQNGYMAKFTPLGQRLWGTYFGGSGTSNQSIANSPNGGYYIAGFTTSTTGVATPGAYQTVNNGNDGYISRFYRDTFVVINQPYTDTLVCPNGTFNVAYSTSYAFNSGNIFTAQLSDINGSFTTPTSIGSATATASGTISVTIPSGTALGIGYRIRIVASSPAYTSPDQNIDIHVISSIAAPSITGNTPVCVGDSIIITAANNATVTPNSMLVTGPNGFISSTPKGVVPFATSASSGNYVASVTHNGCPAATASVTIVVNSVIPATPTATSNSPICSGTSINISASSASAATYRITGPQGFVSSAQNTVIPNANINRAGYYYITDTVNGCRSAKDSILVSISQSITTTINVVATPGDTVCQGTGFSFVAVTTNAGNNPQFQWRIGDVNLGDTAVVGATSNVYASQFLTSGDVIYCILRSYGQCLSNPIDTSNKVKITILQPSTPQVTISVSPSNIAAQGTLLTFTSTTILGGNNTSYQWYVNGHPVANDTLSTASFHTLADSDVVTVIVHNHILCAAPDSAVSNAIRVHITTGVSKVEAALNTLNLYPNPNNGVMSLTGQLDGLTSKTMQLEILNAVGQVVYNHTASVSNGTVNEPIQIGADVAAGTYLMRIEADGESRVIRFTVQK